MKVGFACGVFDLFHAGHVMMLQECKEHCDYLIVAVNSTKNIDYTINPNKNKPIYSLEHRVLILENSRYVDKVLVYDSEEELEEILKKEKIDIRFLGTDYKGKAITAPDAVKEVYYTNRDHGLSTSKIRSLIEKNN